MHYLGSKARHADQILAHVLRDRRQGQLYVEPFVGGGNVLNKVPQEQGPRLANDFNPFMIALLKRLSEGWEPRLHITRPEYERLRAEYEQRRFNLAAWTEDEMADVAAIALGASFGSLWFGSWANDPPDRPGMRWGQGRAACLRDAPGLRGAMFVTGSYEQIHENAKRVHGLEIPGDAIFYCDPPYRGTTGYDGAAVRVEVGESAGKNDWKAAPFWRWCDDLVARGHTVFVSEYSGPPPETYREGAIGPDEANLRKHAGELQRRLDQIQESAANPTQQDSDIVDLEFEAEDPAPVERELREVLAAIDQHAAERFKLVHEQIEKWNVVWSKDVAVTVTSAKQSLSSQTEKLFTRSPE